MSAGGSERAKASEGRSERPATGHGQPRPGEGVSKPSPNPIRHDRPHRSGCDRHPPRFGEWFGPFDRPASRAPSCRCFQRSRQGFRIALGGADILHTICKVFPTVSTFVPCPDLPNCAGCRWLRPPTAGCPDPLTPEDTHAPRRSEVFPAPRDQPQAPRDRSEQLHHERQAPRDERQEQPPAVPRHNNGHRRRGGTGRCRRDHGGGPGEGRRAEGVCRWQ